MPSCRTSWAGLLNLLAAVALWSTAEVVTRLVVYDLTPLQLAATRFVVGGAVLVPFLPRDLRRRGLRPTRRILLHSAWIALIGVVTGSVAYQLALRNAGAGLVATVFGASPLMAMLLAAPILGEPITAPKAIGLLTGLLGIAVLGLTRESPVFSLAGLGYAMLTAFCFAAFTVLVKRFGGPYAGLPITVFCSMVGAAVLGVLAAAEADWAMLANLPRVGLPVLYLAVGPTGLAYLFFFRGLERVEATQATSIVLLKPPLATVLAAWWLGEPVSWNLAAAMVLIVGGLYLVVQFTRARRPDGKR